MDQSRSLNPLNRREHIYTLHLIAQTHVTSSLETCPPKYLLNIFRCSAGPCRPRFSFFCIKLSKNRPWQKPPSTGTSRHQVQPRKPTARPQGHTVNPFEALLEGSSLAQQSENHQRASFRAHSATASGAPPSLCRYIDPTNQNCQHAFSKKTHKTKLSQINQATPGDNSTDTTPRTQ